MALYDDRRAAWGAAPAKTGSLVKVSPSQRQYFFVHWNGPKMSLSAADPHSKCLAQVRAFQRFHMVTNGWADIGYDGLTCPHGRNIEGRGVEYRGSHCTGFNTTGHGWQAMVGEGNPITPAMYAGVRRAYDELCKRDGKTLLKRGHRDGMSTTCPGATLYAWVKAGMPASAGGTVPAPAPAPAPTKLVSTLKRGDTGPEVVLLQKMLNKTRNAGLSTDGSFGPAVEAAVIAAHVAWGIGTPHNVVGQGFRDKINAEYVKVPAPAPAPAPTPAPKPTPAPAPAPPKEEYMAAISPEDWRKMTTGPDYAFYKDVLSGNPETAPRVPLGRAIEDATTAALKALAELEAIRAELNKGN